MRNGLIAWYNFFCLVFVIHAHLLHAHGCFAMVRIEKLVVPLFSILAGYSWGGLLKRTRGDGAIYGLKLFLYPYLFWSAMYMLLNDVFLDCFVRHCGFELSLGDVVYNLFTGYSALHLWFLITLVYVSLIITWLYRMFHGSMWYGIAVAALLALSIIVPEMDFMATPNRYVEYFHTWFFWVLPGFSIGLLAAIPKSKVYEKRWIKSYALPSMWILGVIMLFCGHGRGIELPLAAALIVTALVFPRVDTPKWTVATISYIMGVYLIHALFTSAFNVALRLTPEHPLPELLAWPVAVIIFFVSWGVVWALRKIPVVKNLV